MEQLTDPTSIQDIALMIKLWTFDNVFVLSNLEQLAVISLAFIVARLATPKLSAWVETQRAGRDADAWASKAADAVIPLTLPIIWLALQWVAVLIAAAAAWPHHIIVVVNSLLTAWVVIHLSSNVIRDPAWARLIAITAWSVAALNIVGLLDDTIVLLDGIAFNLGELRVSALSLIKGMLSLAVFLWLATAASRLMEKRIHALPSLTPSIQVLFAKLLKVVLITVAILAALHTVGIDLTAFAVLSGAIGVGIGFGLQKVVSNLICGVILLLDRSVKPGDVIAIGDTYGWINSLGARYVSVVTRDGTEHLIPNEDLITQRVENWSFSHNRVRLKIPIGVAYESDVHKVIELCEAAANATPRVLDEPTVQCLLMGFGDSSVDLELRIWIDDPPEGIANVKSDVLLRVWDSFHENNIRIPFPQRDLHIRSPDEIAIVSRAADKGAARGAKKGNAGSKPRNDRKPAAR